VIGKDYWNWTDIMFIYSPREDSYIFCRAALFIIKLSTQPSHCTDIFGLSKEEWFNLDGQLLPRTGSSLTSFQAFLSFWDAHWPCRNTVSDESPTSITLQFRSTWLSSGSYGTQGPQSWMNWWPGLTARQSIPTLVQQYN